MKIPLLGLGTYGLVGDKCRRVITEAIKMGYQHIDTASVYQNHQAIGEAVRGFDRKKLFITSKIALDEIDDKKIEQSVCEALERALNDLQMDYLDLYLIHWPNRHRPILDILQVLNKCIKQQHIRHVGVSNFTMHHIQDLLATGLKIEANQVEFHPYLYQRELYEYCLSNRIQLISYRPFGKGKLLKEEPLFQEIGKKYGKSSAQVVLRWVIQQGIAVIPKASSKSHLEENFSIFDFELSLEDMRHLERLDRNKRYCMPDEIEFNY